jgi:hypothetical protein
MFRLASLITLALKWLSSILDVVVSVIGGYNLYFEWYVEPLISSVEAKSVEATATTDFLIFLEDGDEGVVEERLARSTWAVEEK